ncbi:hypothetical protein [Halomonas alimentaria]|uniref:Uncharacterized protein n=1 Tax=Halomonas alimentaria TaxID=147248 RepID=A0A7X4W7E2_9GAMM|nr:hypothetical protein [Halomonas alimentaria]NAW35739.1 hypothetical protein [Halomonas alimentaria]
MPRNSWTSLDQERSAPISDASTPSEPPPLPESLLALQRERDALERRMQRLTQGGAEPADDARFPVTPLSVRRRADAAWARQRDRLGGAATDAREEIEAAAEPSVESEREPLPALRTGLRRLGEPLERSGLLQDSRLRQHPEPAERLSTLAAAGQEALTRRYAAQRDRLLSVVTGGCGDLDRRAESARRRALSRRREALAQQQADDRRVDQARRQRQLQEDA